MLKKRKRKRQFQNVQRLSICTLIRDDKLAIYITENSFKETALSQNKVWLSQCDKIGTDMGRHRAFPKHNYYGNYCFGALLNTVSNSCYCLKPGRKKKNFKWLPCTLTMWVYPLLPQFKTRSFHSLLGETSFENHVKQNTKTFSVKVVKTKHKKFLPVFYLLWH